MISDPSEALEANRYTAPVKPPIAKMTIPEPVSVEPVVVVARQRIVQPTIPTVLPEPIVVADPGPQGTFGERCAKYGMTFAEGQAAFKGQCEICHRLMGIDSAQLVFDHEHASGQFRGFLCQTCNSAIGLLMHSVEACQNAARYLQGFEEKREK